MFSKDALTDCLNANQRERRVTLSDQLEQYTFCEQALRNNTAHIPMVYNTQYENDYWGRFVRRHRHKQTTCLAHPNVQHFLIPLHHVVALTNSGKPLAPYTETQLANEEIEQLDKLNLDMGGNAAIDAFDHTDDDALRPDIHSGHLLWPIVADDSPTAPVIRVAKAFNAMPFGIVTSKTLTYRIIEGICNDTKFEFLFEHRLSGKSRLDEICASALLQLLYDTKRCTLDDLIGESDDKEQVLDHLANEQIKRRVDLINRLLKACKRKCPVWVATWMLTFEACDSATTDYSPYAKPDIDFEHFDIERAARDIFGADGSGSDSDSDSGSGSDSDSDSDGL